MNRFHIFVDNRPRCFIWGFDEHDAAWKIHRETGIAMSRICARHVYSEFKENY